jgi:hypothetical protein
VIMIERAVRLSHGSSMGLYDRDYMREKPEPEEAETPSSLPGTRRAVIITVGLILLVALAVALISQ